MTSVSAPLEPQSAAVDLYWIPLGAGARSVRFNGLVYEAMTAAIEHRRRHDIYHSALSIVLPSGHYMVEMTPVPDAFGASRGVVAEGPVGLRPAGRLRVFRYEVRRWRDGLVPDLSYAVASPINVTNDPATARRVFDLLPLVPTATWGRDELGAGEMWTCNSIISWALATAGVDLATLAWPTRARAPGWDAGRIVAGRPWPGCSMSASASGLEPHLGVVRRDLSRRDLSIRGAGTLRPRRQSSPMRQLVELSRSQTALITSRLPRQSGAQLSVVGVAISMLRSPRRSLKEVAQDRHFLVVQVELHEAIMAGSWPTSSIERLGTLTPAGRFERQRVS